MKETDRKYAKKVASLTGKTFKEVSEWLDMLELEYGLTPKAYLKREFYLLPENEQLEKADELRIYKKRLKTLQKKLLISREEAKEKLANDCEVLGVTPEQYMDDKLYRFDIETAKERLEAKAETEKLNKIYIEDIAFKSGKSVEETAKIVKEAGRKYGITPHQYLVYGYHNMSEAAMATDYLMQVRHKKIEHEMYAKIEEATGKNREQVEQEMAMIRAKMPYMNVTLYWLYRTGCYAFDFSGDQFDVDHMIFLTIWRTELKSRLDKKFAQIDQGILRYSDIKEDIDEFYKLQSKMTSPLFKKDLLESLLPILPELEFDEEKREKIILDVAVTRFLLGFNEIEYAMFRFDQKELFLRRTYISEIVRAYALKRLNTPKALNAMNSKYQAYRYLKPFYKREIVLIDPHTGYETFKDFYNRHEVFVKKTNFDSLGRGVEKVERKEGVVLRNLFEKLTDGKVIILEELIKPHNIIKFINPSSVNTVRINVLLRNGVATVQDAFMKVGREGSFVDNGGAGGIFVYVDKETGTFYDSGVDEKGVRYEKHPDHGYPFKNFRLPDWDKACEVAKKAIFSVYGLTYIGWDLTYTEDNEWIIIEGNSMTQFLAFQGASGRGCKAEFFSAVDYNHLPKVVPTLPKPNESNYRFKKIDAFDCFSIEDKITTEMKRHYVEERCFAELEYFPNLNDPQTINEKILWLALYYKNPNIAYATDKTTAKNYIADKIGSQYTVKTYGIYDNASDIDFDSLPNSFVVKLNDGWGANTVKLIKDKSRENLGRLKAELSSWLYPWNTYYYNNLCITDSRLEKARLIVEELLENKGKASINDFKFYCCNGEPKYALIVSDRLTPDESRTFVDMDWNVLPTGRKSKMFSLDPIKPENLELMLQLCRKLSEEFPFVRIDFYEIDGKVYVGEMTFTPGMFMRFTTQEWDHKLGQYLDLTDYLPLAKN